MADATLILSAVCIQPELISELGVTDNSRISNANYFGNNPGAFFREDSGRIGSNPDFDDYSEEGYA